MGIFNSKEHKYKVLYLFITHQGDYLKTLNRCTTNYSDFLITVGGQRCNKFGDVTLYLDVDDSYDGLPEKVFNALQNIVINERFTRYSHICKLDSDMLIRKRFRQQDLADNHYFGSVHRGDGDRSWGQMKFSSKSKFSTQEYKGHYVPWCLGGYGYVISFSAVRKILFEAINFNDQPYEDLLIAKLLKKKGIHPKNVEDLRDYICSPVHR